MLRLKAGLIAAWGLMMVVGFVWAGEMIYDRTQPNLGLAGVLSPDQQPWRSKTMTCPQAVTDACRLWTGKDFFEGEYGKPCLFDQDWLRQQGFSKSAAYQVKNGQLVFTTGDKGFQFGFGSEPGDARSPSRPSIRFGCAWFTQRKDWYRLEMTLTQSVPESSWTFSVIERGRLRPVKTFKITGTGRQTYQIDLGMVRELTGDGGVYGPGGIQFSCDTPNATVQIRSITIAPSSAKVYFRKKIDLPAKAIESHATFQVCEQYELYVNDQKIDTGTGVYPTGLVKTVDLTPYLKPGANTIAFGREFITWSLRSPEWLFEAVAIDRRGQVTRILSDDGWKTSLSAQGSWWQTNYDDAAWQSPKLSVPNVVKTAEGTSVWNGVEPRHMGVLQAAPTGQKYPVFTHTQAIGFTAKIPAGLKDARLELGIFEAGTTRRVETVDPSEALLDGDWAVFRMPVVTRTPGAYRLEWRLTDPKNGQVIDQRRDELVIAGPIPQDVLSLADFEPELESRLKLVQSIDCAAPPPDDTQFLDHSGEYRPVKTNLGKVVERDGMRYRQTGPGIYDWYGYRLHLKELGVAYLVEIVVPDNADRYVYSGVVEQHPIEYPNNFRTGARAWVSVTGTCLTGMGNPMTMRTRKLRYIYWPRTPAAAVTVMNGTAIHPAAACQINLYRIEGGLPALRVPESDRWFGSLNERLTVMALGTACESTLANNLILAKNNHRDAWYHWYKQFERRIAWLRYQGRNMTSEGLYMYNEGDVPSTRHNSGVSDDELDPMNLGLKMYQANGIHCLLGFEYLSTPAMWWPQNTDGLSDRRMQLEGEPSIHMVDRYGRQVLGFRGALQNFLDPRVEAAFMNAVDEIVDRYRDAGRVDGLTLVAGSWWVPGFLTYPQFDSSATPTDVGYDDTTVGRFEAETSIKLGIALTDPQRFAKRYDALMSKHREQWLAWRCRKVQEFVQKISQRLTRHDTRWPLYLCPQPTLGNLGQSPFALHGDPRQRDTFLKQKLEELGFDLQLYRDDPMIRVVLQLPDPKDVRQVEDRLQARSVSTHSSTTELLKSCAGFFRVTSLNEMSFPADSASQWLWRETARAAFTMRPIGDNGMEDFVDILAHSSTPRIILYDWIDCNMDTAFGAQQRRFAKSFYVTPQASFRSLPADRSFGPTAQTAPRPEGGTWLWLVNHTPYAVTGTIVADSQGIDDWVYDQPLKCLSSVNQPNTYRLDMPPNDIRLLLVHGDVGTIATHLTFAQDDVTVETFSHAKTLLSDAYFTKHAPANLLQAIRSHVDRQDAVAVRIVLKDSRLALLARQVTARLQAISWQNQFLDDLRQTGSTRIICASPDVYTDRQNRRWCPDQSYVDQEAYGHIGANYADRGDLAIDGTDAPRVYQTEAYGSEVQYLVPLPNGLYTLHVHVAETYRPLASVGARLFTMKIQDQSWPQPIDPFAMAGGFAKAHTLTQKNVRIINGLLRLEFKGRVGVSGIEVVKATSSR